MAKFITKLVDSFKKEAELYKSRAMAVPRSMRHETRHPKRKLKNKRFTAYRRVEKDNWYVNNLRNRSYILVLLKKKHGIVS